MKTLSISQVQRELHHLNDFDIIKILGVMKKTGC